MLEVYQLLQRHTHKCRLRIQLVEQWRTAQQHRVSPRSENAEAMIMLVAIISARGAERR